MIIAFDMRVARRRRYLKQWMRHCPYFVFTLDGVSKINLSDEEWATATK